jgi:hypothetical protein
MRSSWSYCNAICFGVLVKRLTLSLSLSSCAFARSGSLMHGLDVGMLSRDEISAEFGAVKV